MSIKMTLSNQKPKTICSIDASTNSLAFAIFSDISLVAFGKINFQGANTYAKVKDAARKSYAFFNGTGLSVVENLLEEQYNVVIVEDEDKKVDIANEE